LNQKNTTIVYLGLSASGVVLLIIGSLFISPNGGTITLFDRAIVGGAFITSCIIGFSLALKPNWIRGKLGEKGNKTKYDQDNTKPRARLGHHPDCDGFSSHVIRTNNKTLCAGCLGLAIGSFFGIVLVSFYIFIPRIIDSLQPISVIMTGLLFIGFNFIVVVIKNKSVYLHLISNVFLVVGFFFVVMGILQHSGTISLGILAVILSFLWLDTRIQLSHWYHNKICLMCDDPCKVYSS
jgi:hypothetical protein